MILTVEDGPSDRVNAPRHILHEQQKVNVINKIYHES